MVLAVDGLALDQDVNDKMQQVIVRGEKKSVRRKKSKGFSREESEKILSSGGRAEMLRCKVRYFSDGVVLGSKDFVNNFYKRLKTSSQKSANYQGQYENREQGARKVKHMKGEQLYSMRNLQKKVIE